MADEKSASWLVFRADASSEIGTGHVMRCLALAQEWIRQGGSASFLGHCESASLSERIESCGVNFIPLEKPHPDPSDLKITLEKLQQLSDEGHSPLWLALDGYHFSPSYQQAIHLAGHKLLVIDDEVNLPEYHADVLLNQNLSAEQLIYPCSSDTLLLLGARYALLRQEFQAWKNWKREIPARAQKILVTMGGSDPDNVTLKVIEAFHLIKRNGMEVKVVLGAENAHAQTLRNAAKKVSCSIEFIPNASNMPELMAWADLAITAGGSTCWELAFMGVPMITIVLAENQNIVATALEQQEAAINLGWHSQTTSQTIAAKLGFVIENKILHRNQSRVSRLLVDGEGARRVATLLKGWSLADGVSLIMRQAVSEDAMQLWRLANDSLERKNSFHPEQIPLDRHLEWLEQKLSTPDSQLWVLVFEETILGQVRYDRIDHNTVEMHFTVNPAFRGKGIGTKLLNLACENARKEMKISRAQGVVFKHNIASARAFEKAGFKNLKEKHQDGQECYVFERNLCSPEIAYETRT